MTYLFVIHQRRELCEYWLAEFFQLIVAGLLCWLAVGIKLNEHNAFIIPAVYKHTCGSSSLKFIKNLWWKWLSGSFSITSIRRMTSRLGKMKIRVCNFSTKAAKLQPHKTWNRISFVPKRSIPKSVPWFEKMMQLLAVNKK